MAKKSRRQKLPTEKDLEKLSAPKPGESGDAPDSHSDRNEATHCHFERSEAESRNLATSPSVISSKMSKANNAHVTDDKRKIR